MNNLNRQEYINKAGIYIIHTNFFDKIYVGSSNCLYKRINGHINSLIKNKHKNPRLQYYVNKHGINKLEVSIIYTFPKKPKLSELLGIEQHYYDIYSKNHDCFNSFSSVSYFNNNPKNKLKAKEAITLSWKNNYNELKEKAILNLEKAKEACKIKRELGIKTVSPMKGKRHSEDSKKKQSESALKRGRHKSRCKKVYRYTINGIYIDSFDAYKDAAIHIFGNYKLAANIRKCVMKCRLEAGGYVWRNNRHNKLKLNYTLIDLLNNETLEFIKLSHIAKFIKIDNSVISRAISDNKIVKNRYKILKNEQ